MTDVYPVIAESTPDGDGWVHSCGTTLLGATVTHSVHDGIIPLAGSGRVEREVVPYCPKCQDPPNPIGAPVTRPYVDDTELAVLKRMRDG